MGRSSPGELGRPVPLSAEPGQRAEYQQTAVDLRALAARLQATVDSYEASPRGLDTDISSGPETAGQAETMIMNVYSLMRRQVFNEESPLRVSPEVWTAFQRQQPEFISFFETACTALETYSEILCIYQRVSGAADRPAQPGDLDGIRRDKHVQVEERRQCIAAVREFSSKLSAMLAVL
jgi:hypothetical protein